MKKKTDGKFINDISKDEIVAELRLLEASPAYETQPAYRGSSPRWTNNYISFVEYHLNYLKAYPSLNPEKYISNLRLKLRK